jgi:hypothetical protein
VEPLAQPTIVQSLGSRSRGASPDTIHKAPCTAPGALGGFFEARLSCVSVLALGARRQEDDDAELGYFAVRAALAPALPNVAELPTALPRFVAVIGETFGSSSRRR